MKQPLISHEVPKCLLNESLNWNSYQYSLPHLLESDEEYRNFFLKCKEDGREIYLDNSLHELGVSLNDDILLKWLNILKPSTFFVPDVWENQLDTIANSYRWIKYHNIPEETTLTAVIQATSLKEAGECYKAFKNMGYKKFAFSYGASYYNELFLHPNVNIGKALGRVNAISILKHMNIIEDTDRIHLLGCSVPGEMIFYKGMPFIESVDSSNPIMAALDGIYYSNGFHDKPKANMNNSFYIDIDKIDMYALEHNVNAFKQLFK